MSQNLNLLRQKYCRPASFTGKTTSFARGRNWSSRQNLTVSFRKEYARKHVRPKTTSTTYTSS